MSRRKKQVPVGKSMGRGACVFVAAICIGSVFLGRARGAESRKKECSGAERELVKTVETLVGVINAGDEARAKDAMLALFPTRDEFEAVFPRKGEALWEKLKGRYALEKKDHIKMIKLWAVSGNRSVTDITDLRSAGERCWVYHELTTVVDAKYPLYRVSLGRPGKRIRDSLTSFVRVNGRWVWFRGVEKVVLDAYREKPEATPPPVRDDTAAALVASLTSKEAGVAKSAKEALCKIGEPAVPALVEALREGDLPLKKSAASVLARIGPGTKDAVPALVEALKIDEKPKRHSVPLFVYAASALASIGPEAKAAVPELLKRMDAGSSGDRLAIVKALLSVGPDSKEAVPPLVKALGDSNKHVRLTAVRTLYKMGSTARDAKPALKKALSDENKSVRLYAERTLEKIRGGKGH
jgi:hypothetical protein